MIDTVLITIKAVVQAIIFISQRYLLPFVSKLKSMLNNAYLVKITSRGVQQRITSNLYHPFLHLYLHQNQRGKI